MKKEVVALVPDYRSYSGSYPVTPHFQQMMEMETHMKEHPEEYTLDDFVKAYEENSDSVPKEILRTLDADQIAELMSKLGDYSYWLVLAIRLGHRDLAEAWSKRNKKALAALLEPMLSRFESDLRKEKSKLEGKTLSRFSRGELDDLTEVSLAVDACKAILKRIKKENPFELDYYSFEWNQNPYDAFHMSRDNMLTIVMYLYSKGIRK